MGHCLVPPKALLTENPMGVDSKCLMDAMRAQEKAPRWGKRMAFPMGFPYLGTDDKILKRAFQTSQRKKREKPTQSYRETPTYLVSFDGFSDGGELGLCVGDLAGIGTAIDCTGTPPSVGAFVGCRSTSSRVLQPGPSASYWPGDENSRLQLNDDLMQRKASLWRGLKGLSE